MASIKLNKDEKLQTKPLFTEDIMTTRDVAALLRLQEVTVCKLATSGELPGIKIGKSWRFARSEVLRRITTVNPAQK